MGQGAELRKRQKLESKKKAQHDKESPLETTVKKSKLPWILGTTLAGLIAVGVGIYSHFSKDEVVEYSEPAKIERKVEDEWDFFNRNGKELQENSKPVSSRMCFEKFVPLRYEVELGQGDELWELMRRKNSLMGDKTLAVINELNLDQKLSYSLTVTGQPFGVPENSKIAEKVKKYYEKGIELMYKELPFLKKLDVDLTIIKKSQNFEHKFHKKFFICKNYYSLCRVYLKSPNLPNLNELIHTEIFHRYGAETVTFSKKPHAGEWMAVLSTNNSSLFSLFSEIIPLTLSKEYVCHIEMEGKFIAGQAMEAVSEVAANEYGMKLANMMGVPNVKRKIKKMEDHLIDPIYDLIPYAKKTKKQIGTTALIQLYMKNPAKFIPTIKNKNGIYKN